MHAFVKALLLAVLALLPGSAKLAAPAPSAAEASSWTRRDLVPAPIAHLFDLSASDVDDEDADLDGDGFDDDDDDAICVGLLRPASPGSGRSAHAPARGAPSAPFLSGVFRPPRTSV